MIHSMDDGAVPVDNSIEYALAMKKHIFRTNFAFMNVEGMDTVRDTQIIQNQI